MHVKADRLSRHRFIANQFRLLLHACAYWLMDALRRKLIESGTRRIGLPHPAAAPPQDRREGQERPSPRSACIWPRDIQSESMARSFHVLRKRL